MSRKLRFSIPFFLILICLSVCSQEFIGLYSGNYAGVSSISKNPAAAVAKYPLTWDINLASVGLSVNTNYAHIVDASIFDVIRADEIKEISPENASDVVQYDFSYNLDKKSYLMENITINGPSFLLKNDNRSFGLFTNYRNHLGVNRVDADLGVKRFETNPDQEYFDVSPFKAGFINWSEIGLHYGTMLNKQFSIGANVKYIMAYDAFFLNNNSTTTLTKREDDLLFDNIDLVAGMAGNLDANDDEQVYNFQQNGNGVSIDLGFNYLYKTNRDLPYKISLGASLVDIGFVSFKKKAAKYEVETNNPFEIRTGPLYIGDGHTQLIDEVLQQAEESDIVDGTFYESKKADYFKIWMPAGIILQADYAFSKSFFTSATIVQRIRLKGAMAERSNSLNLTPRFESRLLEVMMPFTVVNDTKLNVGMAVRLAFLTIGTDNLMSFTETTELNGVDFYASIKINPFDLNFSRNKSNNRTKSKSSISCPKL